MSRATLPCNALNTWLESHSGPDTWQLVKTRVVLEIVFEAEAADSDPFV
jgi:hypothetical protein